MSREGDMMMMNLNTIRTNASRIEIKEAKETEIEIESSLIMMNTMKSSPEETVAMV
jgi:hypothetical protein